MTPTRRSGGDRGVVDTGTESDKLFPLERDLKGSSNRLTVSKDGYSPKVKPSTEVEVNTYYRLGMRAVDGLAALCMIAPRNCRCRCTRPMSPKGSEYRART